MKKIEELLINADPSSCVVLDHGFMIRCYNTKDLCTINRLSNEGNSGEIIKLHMERLAKMKINPCYRIVYDSSYQELDHELVRHGFNVIDRGVVMALNIENMERELFAFANFYEQGILSDEGISGEWFADFRELVGMDVGYGDIFENNLKNSLEEKMSFGLLQNERLIAMGYATFIREYLIINQICVEPRFRNLDYGKKLLKAMLIKGLLKGCKAAICDIRENEEEALNMVAKEGFERLYSYQLRGKNLK